METGMNELIERLTKVIQEAANSEADQDEYCSPAMAAAAARAAIRAIQTPLTSAMMEAGMRAIDDGDDAELVWEKMLAALLAD
jgi:hypothetical protein